MKMIVGKTRLVGLLGQPVDHSLSPVIHNAALQEMGLDWSYMAMPCNKNHLKLVIDALMEIECKGLNITIPHKQNAMSICKYIDPLGEKVGAVNTLVPTKDKEWSGFNTDVKGFMTPLKEKESNHKKALILGCGGSARAVITGLEKLKIREIVIAARNPDSLAHFINNFKLRKSSDELSKLKIHGVIDNQNRLINHIETADIIINSTPIGMCNIMQNKADEMEFPFGTTPWTNLKPETILYDLIYTPRPTPWLAYGNEKGCKIIDGLEMLIQQGAESLKLWTNQRDIPIDQMRKAAAAYLLQ